MRWVVDQGAEALIHCGDLTGPDVVYAFADLPGYYVFGNNDFDEEDLRRAISDVGRCLPRTGGGGDAGGAADRRDAR